MDFAVMSLTDLALNFLCVAETFVNIVYVIGARAVFMDVKMELLLLLFSFRFAKLNT